MPKMRRHFRRHGQPLKQDDTFSAVLRGTRQKVSPESRSLVLDISYNQRYLIPYLSIFDITSTVCRLRKSVGQITIRKRCTLLLLFILVVLSLHIAPKKEKPAFLVKQTRRRVVLPTERSDDGKGFRVGLRARIRSLKTPFWERVY